MFLIWQELNVLCLNIIVILTTTQLTYVAATITQEK